MSDPVTLLPCPFCGEEAGDITHSFTPQLLRDGTVNESRRVACSNGDCLVNWSTRPSAAAAIEHWNTRAIPAPRLLLHPDGTIKPLMVVKLPNGRCPDRVAPPGMEHYTDDYSVGWNDALMEVETILKAAGVTIEGDATI